MKKIGNSITIFCVAITFLISMSSTACAEQSTYTDKKNINRADILSTSSQETETSDLDRANVENDDIVIEDSSASLTAKTDQSADKTKLEDDKSPNTAAMSAYEDFLSGNRTVLYHSANVKISNIISPEEFSDEESYSLNNLIGVFQDAADKKNSEKSQGSGYAAISKVEYAILGKSEFPVLALHIVGDNFLGSEAADMWYLIHYNIEHDQLNIAYGEDSLGRSNIQINNDGIVIASGSSGASEHSSRYYKIDMNGEVHKIYNAVFSSLIADNTLDLTDWDKGYSLVSYYLETEQYSPEGQINAADYYTLIHNNESDDTFRLASNMAIDKTNPVYRKYTDENIKLVDRSTVIKAILQRMKEMNISLESLYSDKPIWTKYEWEVPQVTIEDIRKGISEGNFECGMGYIGGSYNSDYPEGDIDETVCRPGMEKYGFLSDIPIERRLKIEGGELYCIVPRAIEDQILIYGAKFDFDKMEYDKTDLLYDSKNDTNNNPGDPILLSCNPSELYGNTIVELYDKDGNLYSHFMPAYRPTTPIELVGAEDFYEIK